MPERPRSAGRWAPALLGAASLVALANFRSSTPGEAFGTLGYVRGDAVWVEMLPGSPRAVPGSRGAALLAFSPNSGALAFLTGPPDRPRTPYLSEAPFTSSVPLARLFRDERARRVRADRLAWQEDGRALVVDGPDGPVGWDMLERAAFTPARRPWASGASRDGRVRASPLRGALGVAVTTPAGTRTFPRGAFRRAARAAGVPLATTRTVATDWAFSAPRVSPDGARVAVTANLGRRASDGETRHVHFEVDVPRGTLRAKPSATFEGDEVDVRLGPIGRASAWLVTRRADGGAPTTRVFVANDADGAPRELAALRPRRGRLNVLSGACWLADGRHLAVSVARPRARGATPEGVRTLPQRSFELLIVRASDGAVVRRRPSAVRPACGPNVTATFPP